MSEYFDEWNSWRKRRWEAVDGDFGIASLVGTHWLGPEPRELPGLDGTWRVVDGDVVGDDVTIEPGSEVVQSGRLLRHLRREDEVALRVFDPAAPTRTALDRVEVFPYDERWRLHGRFTPAEHGETVDIESVDGHVAATTIAGTVSFEVDGEAASFVVTQEGRDLFATFGDETNGDETYRFRFLLMSVEGDDVVVDLNRAYLPNCAFSDHYLCPLPPASNRLTVAVRAGERAAVREE